jgi:hypothetical protein
MKIPVDGLSWFVVFKLHEQGFFGMELFPVLFEEKSNSGIETLVVAKL